ncbi:MAG: hypothetical protein LC789_06350 [Actinobacteria bacterium]|nr:hypothetical protein [Actinomycetota bacterium]MCA1722243.1 hypothetical protein [Actinomycetota bacterium]
MNPRSAAAMRGGYGVLLLTQPARVAGVLGAPVEGSHPVLRILGVRQVVEAAAAVIAKPTTAVLDASVAVDALHVLSCLGFAAVRPERRRPALGSAALATALLVATWLSGRADRSART